MSGIIFFKTKTLDIIHHFYHYTLEMEVWLEQPNCYIFKKGNLLLGFLQSETAETEGIITIFDENKANIDAAYKKYKSLVIQDLKENKIFKIYHFYISDPEGRRIEFQTFLHPLPAYKTLDEGLINRRSIRKFQAIQVDPQVLNNIFELCRYSPTSRNSQSYHYLVITNKKDLEWLGNVRKGAGGPILNAPMAVIVISDNTKTIRLEQDSDIAGTYFMLSAYAYNVSTCWITDMDRNEIKTRFNIPPSHFITCVIATGYADEIRELPYRREILDFVKYDKY